MLRIAVIGTTSWGTTLSIVLAREKLSVRLWARTKEDATHLRTRGPVPGTSHVQLPPRVTVTTSLKQALDDAKAVILAVPSQTMRQNIQLVAKHLKPNMLVISAAKGLESGSGKRMSQVIADEIDEALRPNICVLSGPNLAQEIVDGLPAASVVAADSEEVSRAAQRLLNGPDFCVYTNTDIVGVEVGGALKNIIALGAGIADGLGYGDNAKAAFITRGLTEITALAVALGANPLTLSGLAGLGDLIATCASPLSRNHYVGMQLAKGRLLEEITSTMNGVAEGVGTTLAAWSLSQKMGIEMPITEKMYRILYENADPREAVAELTSAQVGHELSGRKWRLFKFLQQRKAPQKTAAV